MYVYVYTRTRPFSNKKSVTLEEQKRKKNLSNLTKMSAFSPKPKEELQVGTMAEPCMITSYGSEFDGPKAKSASARVAVVDAASAESLKTLDAKGKAAAEAAGREYNSFIVGETKDGSAPVIRVKITRSERGYTCDPAAGAPESVLELDGGCAILLKVSPFQWTREDDRYGPKLGITLYANVVYCGGRLDNFKLMEADQQAKKREATWA